VKRAAVSRSLRIYHAPGRAEALDGFYRRFLGAGDVAFDVGAHVGDRMLCFRRLCARVVAVEPQAALARVLRLLLRGDPGVTLVSQLVGARAGRAELRLNTANPTVATASTAFIAAASGAPGWEGQEWDQAETLPVTTLDALIAAHGMPAFIKLDIEGFEAEALKALSHPPRALSFEFTTIQRDVAGDCLGLLAALGYRHFQASLGESLSFALPAPCDAAAMQEWIAALPVSANSGDVYASLDQQRLT
jgi:FkbM family methyltransferase